MKEVSQTKRHARIAGFLYLILLVFGPFVLMYIPSKIKVRGDIAATAGNMLQHEFLFRCGAAVGLMVDIAFVFLVLSLYRLFKSVHEFYARSMVALVLITVAVTFVLEALSFSSLMLLKNEVLAAFTVGQKQSLALLFLTLDSYATQLVQLYWGVWLFPLSYLVYKSEFMPRILGVLLALNGIAYVILCFTFILFPSYQQQVSAITWPLLFCGELPFILYLVFKGVKTGY